MNTIIKVILTALLLLIATYPYFHTGKVPGGLSELR